MPPSGRRSAAPPHETPTLSVTQVHVAGQSESAAQVVAFGVQCFVVEGVHVQSGGGSGTGAGAVDGGAGFATPASTGAELVPPLGVAVPAGAMPVPVEPPHAQESGSGTHENPSPQVASVVHGST